MKLRKACAKDHLGEIGYSPTYGARPLARIMREHVLKPLAKMILRGDAIEGGTIAVRFNAELQSLVLEPSAVGV
jgi:ATP-dependent Clp protease ATP-binding subunit ClpA